MTLPRNPNGNISGTIGNDVLWGAAAILANGVANPLNGLAGSDTLNGGAGNDSLNGVIAADRLIGGIGADHFVFGQPWPSTLGAAGRDVITDFNLAQGDRIDLRGMDANSALAGDQALRFIGAAASSGQAGQLHYRMSRAAWWFRGI